MLLYAFNTDICMLLRKENSGKNFTMFPRILNYSPKFYINSICSKAFTTKLFTFNVSIVKLFSFVFVLCQPNQPRRKSIKRRYLWGYLKDEIDFSSTGAYDWRYQLRILKIEMKFLFTMNRVNYETCLVNPLKSIRQEAGRRQILWRKQFSECSLTDWIKLTPWQYLVWMIRFIKVFIHCVHDLFSIL